MQTVMEYLSDWLALRSGALRARTVESYASLIRLHIAPVIGAVPVDQLDPLHIRPMLARIAGEGHTRTAELCYVLLSAALADLPQLPMRGVPRPAHIQRSPEPWSDDQIAAYMAALVDHPHGLALSLGLVCGLRRGEICGLRWQDVSWETSEIFVTNQRMRLDSGQVIDALPKSRSSVRTVPVPPPLMSQLRHARQLSGYIDGISPSGLDAAHRALVRRLDLPPIPLHGLRHSMATACIRHGGDMRSLQLLLGHARYATTADRYTHPDRYMLRKAIDAANSSWYTVSSCNTVQSGTIEHLTLNQGVQGSSP